jgi:hypothetical protein
LQNKTGSATTSSKDITVTLNGTIVQSDVRPTIISGRTYLPVRAIFEAFGAEMVWDSQARTATALKGDKVVQFQQGSKFYLINGIKVEMDVAMIIISGRSMVPVRFVGQALGGTVNWDENTRTVSITVAK